MDIGGGFVCDKDAELQRMEFARRDEKESWRASGSAGGGNLLFPFG
jgi:hypothetical protein